MRTHYQRSRLHIQTIVLCLSLLFTSCISDNAAAPSAESVVPLPTATSLTKPTALPLPTSVPNLSPPKTATPTALPPTATVEPVVVQPTALPQEAVAAQQPAGQPGAPYVDAPACPSHDSNQWHELWDATRGCHYTHTHNANPSQVDGIFGAVGSWTGGLSISYPWQTLNENQYKHEGYKYAVAADLPCTQDTYEYVTPQPGCVRAYRIEHHALGGTMDGLVRFHSYFAEVRICTRDGGRCGIVRTGGHSDFGILHVPYKEAWMPLPEKDPPELWQYFNDRSQVNLNVDPYRAYNTLDLMQQMRAPEHTCKTCVGPGHELRTTWAGKTHFGGSDWAVGNQIVGFQFWTFDDWGGFNPNNVADYQLVCPDANCRFNSSEHALYTVSVNIAPELDDNSDGIVNYSGFTDLNGNLVATCAAAGNNCVPLSIENAPVGKFLYSFQAPNHDVAQITHDYDQSPEGVWWIQYPN